MPEEYGLNIKPKTEINYNFKWINKKRLPDENEFVCILTRDECESQEAESEFDLIFFLEYVKDKTSFIKLRELGKFYIVLIIFNFFKSKQ